MRLYNYLINVSIVTRWFLFIVPVLALFWIPGILGITTFPNATVCPGFLLDPFVGSQLQLDLGCETPLVEYMAECRMGW